MGSEFRPDLSGLSHMVALASRHQPHVSVQVALQPWTSAPQVGMAVLHLRRGRGTVTAARPRHALTYHTLSHLLQLLLGSPGESAEYLGYDPGYPGYFNAISARHTQASAVTHAHPFGSELARSLAPFRSTSTARAANRTSSRSKVARSTIIHWYAPSSAMRADDLITCSFCMHACA
jgi:hypothetical protein